MKFGYKKVTYSSLQKNKKQKQSQEVKHHQAQKALFNEKSFFEPPPKQATFQVIYQLGPRKNAFPRRPTPPSPPSPPSHHRPRHKLPRIARLRRLPRCRQQHRILPYPNHQWHRRRPVVQQRPTDSVRAFPHWGPCVRVFAEHEWCSGAEHQRLGSFHQRAWMSSLWERAILLSRG